MSLHYLLDGYNIIHQMPGSMPTKLEDQRQKLIQFIENNRPQGSLRNKVTVVFDGQAGVGFSAYGVEPREEAKPYALSPKQAGTVSVVFSKAGSADEKIRKMVEASDRKKSIIVVTNDRDILYAVRASGSKVMGVEEFLSRMKPKARKAKSQEISAAQELAITTELEKVWLKKKK